MARKGSKKSGRKKGTARKKKRKSKFGCQDIQNAVPDSSFYLSRVGITEVRKPVLVCRPKGDVTLTPTIDVFVDLPAKQKGAHMSRNAEIVNALIDSCVRAPCHSLEALCANLARDLLGKHLYANKSEVIMRTDYFLERFSYSGRRSLEPYKLIASARAVRGEVGGVEIEKTIGVEVMGMTACPCAMDTVRMILAEEEDHEVPDHLPTITHNQRNIASITIQVPEGADVEADDLISIIEGTLSSQTFEILKREDEARLVVNAHMNPKFVEDVVRDILIELLKKYENLSDDVKVSVRSVAEESIHKHNAFAERETTLGELRKRS